MHVPHKSNCHLCQADRISAGGSLLKMDSNTDNGETEGMEVDPDLRARMEALMQHYLDTENDGAARENEEGGSGDVGEDTSEDVHAEADELGSEEEEDNLPLPAALPPVLTSKATQSLSSSKPTKPTGTNVKQSLVKKQDPPSEAVRHMVGLFGGNSLINNAALQKIGNRQLNITARMQQMSRQLREQNKISASLYTDASKDLEEYVDLLRRMKEMMNDVDLQLADITRRVSVSVPDSQSQT